MTDEHAAMLVSLAAFVCIGILASISVYRTLALIGLL